MEPMEIGSLCPTSPIKTRHAGTARERIAAKAKKGDYWEGMNDARGDVQKSPAP